MYKLLSKILIVVVIYNRKIIESEAIQSLINNSCLNNLDILIYDNSPFPQKIPELQNINIIYEHDISNPGVSKAYNYACQLGERMKKEWLLIFDQDSILPQNSLNVYCEALKKLPENIFIIAPKLYDDSNKLVSPCKYKFHRGFHLKKTKQGLVKILNISFLNSGLLLNINAIKQVGFFDEKLFDYSDHDFILRFSKKYNNAFIINLIIKHSLSSSKNNNILETTNRLKMLRNAVLYYDKKHKTIFPFFWFMLRSLKLSFLNKNIEYIKIAFLGQ